MICSVIMPVILLREFNIPMKSHLAETIQRCDIIREAIASMASTSGTYRPSNHQGLKEDGTPDKRMHYTETYRPSHHHGLKEDGTPDKRMNTGREHF